MNSYFKYQDGGQLEDPSKPYHPLLNRYRQVINPTLLRGNVPSDQLAASVQQQQVKKPVYNIPAAHSENNYQKPVLNGTIQNNQRAAFQRDMQENSANSQIASISQGHTETPLETANRINANRNFVQTHPYTNQDATGNVSPVNIDRDFDGKGFPNTRAAKNDEALNTTANALDVASTLAFPIKGLAENGVKLGAEVAEQAVPKILTSDMLQTAARSGIREEGLTKGLGYYNIGANAGFSAKNLNDLTNENSSISDRIVGGLGLAMDGTILATVGRTNPFGLKTSLKKTFTRNIGNPLNTFNQHGARFMIPLSLGIEAGSGAWDAYKNNQKQSSSSQSTLTTQEQSDLERLLSKYPNQYPNQ